MPEITSRLSAALADRYRIERRLGEGGMATVFLAEDLKHDRKVALKVLKPELAAVLGAERFVQEIKTTAGLQHPNILPLFDSGEADAFLYYVMPYIEGETLRDKLDRETQLGIDEAVTITTDIADALDYAHRNGVIHRDIKPENILLHDGRPMVADFGIALAVSAAAGGRMTETGLSLGTPHYMSPEQATADKDLTNRSDVYSLGAVLFEMLTGEPPHTGATAQAIVMKIVTDEARPITELRKSVPPNIAAATAKALEKLPADRFASAAEFRGALTDAGFTTPTMGATAGVAPPRARRDPLVIGLAVALAVSTAVAAWALLRPAPAPAVARYSILLPDTGRLAEGFFARVALAPDGSRFVYAGGAQNNRSQLWVRMRDELRAEPLAGTDGGFLPFFSPDGKEVGFMSSGGIRAVAVRGGAGRTIASSRVSGWGASWGSDGYIYADGPGLDPIQRIPEGGGDWEPFTRLEGGVSDDHAFPHVLPNGKGVLFVIRHGATAGDPEIAVAETRTGAHRVLLPGVYAVYAKSGHIVYANGQGDLLAVPFDQDRLELTGDPVSFASGLLGSSNVSLDLTISDDGTLMYVKGSGPGQMERGEPVWVHRDGREEPMVADWTTEAVYVSLSPDQTRLAATINSGTEGIWIRDFTRGTVSKLTFEGGLNRRPEWSPDSREVVFVSDRSGQLEIFAQRADGGAPPERLLRHGNLLQEALYTADGQWMVYRAGGGAGSNLYALRRDGDTIPLPLAVTGFQETAPAVSRDGKWLAYVSDETGSYEVYVRPFPDVERGKWLVSVAGGIEPAWSHDGSELFYRNRNHEMVAVEVLPAATPPTGRQQVLFDAGKYSSDIYHSPWDVAADGQRFAMIRARETDLRESELIVIENFFEALRRLEQ